MKIEIISIGTELLVSDIIDTNSAYISRVLREIDISLTSKVTVGDNVEMIADVMRVALRRADAVLTSGGLGFGDKDYTRQAISLVSGEPLIDFEHDVPGCAFLGDDGQYGKGIMLSLPEGMLICLPGNRRELAYLLEADVLPFLQQRIEAIAKVSAWLFLRTVGVMESSLKQELADIAVGSNHRITFHSFAGQTDIRIWAEHASQKMLDEELKYLRGIIMDRLGDHIFGSEKDLLEQVVYDALKRNGYSLAIGECYTSQVLSRAMRTVSDSPDVVQSTAVESHEALAKELNLEPLDPDHLAQWCRHAAQALLAARKTTLSLIVFNHVTQGGVQILVTLASEYGVSVTQRSFGGHPDNIHQWALTLGLAHLRRWLIVHAATPSLIYPNL